MVGSHQFISVFLFLKEMYLFYFFLKFLRENYKERWNQRKLMINSVVLPLKLPQFLYETQTPELPENCLIKETKANGHSAELALGGTRRLGCVDATISEIPKDNPKYAECKKHINYELNLYLYGRKYFKKLFDTARLQKSYGI